MISTASPALKARSAVEPAEQPARQGDGGGGQHRGDEHAAYPVRDTLDGRLLCLRLLHQSDQVRQLGVRADLDGADHEPPGQRHGAAGDAVAFGGVARYRFPRHHAAVDRGLAEQHLPVGGDAFSRADDEHVPGAQHTDRDLALGAVRVEHAHVLRGRARQLAHRLAGDAPGPCLVQAAREKERGDGGGGLQVDAAARGVDQPLPQGSAGPAAVEDEHGVNRPAAGRDDAQRHQRVHRGSAVPGVLQGGPVERPGAPQGYWRRASDEQPLPAREPQRREQRQHQ